MLQRLYINNYRCLENFELVTKDMPSALLIGRNGAGKSTIVSALEVLQKVGRGINRVKDLVLQKDFARGNRETPIRFEIEVKLGDKLYEYILALELPESFRELRVFEERLSVAGKPIYSRKLAQVALHTSSQNAEAHFLVDWHLVALPIIQEQSGTDPLRVFKTWLARTIILSPIPSLITGESKGDTLEPIKDGSNFGDWFSGLLSRFPASYTEVHDYLSEVMPDIRDFLNELFAKDFKNMVVRFKENSVDLSVDFGDLSDGEKCFFLCAVVLAANKAYGPLFCFWDEPDNYLSLPDVGLFITSLRASFQNNGQILVTSHNQEAIRRFSNENTFLLYRRSHLEPTLAKLLTTIDIQGDLGDALISGDIYS